MSSRGVKEEERGRSGLVGRKKEMRDRGRKKKKRERDIKRVKGKVRE